MTSYQYDAANQLLIAEKGESFWHYVYDANGGVVEVLPNNTETNGAKRYTYNTAGYLTQVETHNGSGWDVQAEMAYNGLGQRLSMDAAGVIAYYVMDGNRPLTVDSNGNTTSYLYGLGIIGEETDAWSYSLPDGTNTQRQLTDTTGEVTYSARYTPWGDTLDVYGTGNLAFGYFGGFMDAATGLLYVGEGQYYDPSTGRFLTRGANPSSPNPYLPFDPTGALFLPLALVSLVYGRKRRKSKWDILVIVALLGLSAGMGVAACGGSGTPSGNITATGTATPVPGGNIVTGTVDINGATMTGTAYVPTSSPYAPIIATPCPTPTGTPTPIPTTDAEYKRIIEERFGIIVSDDTGKWATAHIQIVYSALFNIDVAVGGMLKTLLGTPKKFLREESATYSGTAYGHQINFRFSNKLPHQLIYHEMGHLLNFAQGRKYTYSLDHTAVYTGYPNQTGEFVMGRDCPTTGKCNNPYNRIDGQGYIQHPVIKDPSGYNAETEMHPRKMSADGNTANEEWADLFANFVAGNFDSGDTGRAKYNWVKDQLFGG